MGHTEPPNHREKKKRGFFGFFSRSAGWLFSQKHFQLKVLSGTAAGVTVIALLAGIFLYVTMRNHYQDVMRAHTIEVMRLSGLLENDIATLEAAHRGFLLTGKPLYTESFDQRRTLLKRRMEDLTSLILDSPTQRKRVMKVQDVVQRWLDTVALPEIEARRKTVGQGAPETASAPSGAMTLGNSLLDQGREVLQSLQDEEQIVLNQRMVEQEWAAQSAQILNFLPKLERSVVEMQKEKRGYLLTGETGFVESYKRAVTDFYTYNGYLSILVANAPGQAELLADVRSNLARWISASAPEIEAKGAGKDITVLASSDAGEGLISDIRQMIANLEKHELTVYEARTAGASRERVIKTTVLGCLAILAVALLVVSNSYSFVLVRRQLLKLEGVETRIRSIIENILDGMITMDEQGVICSMNQAAEKMFGYRDNEMVGYKFTKLVPKSYGNEPDAKPAAIAWAAMAKLTGTTILALGRTRKLVSFPAEISLSEMLVDGQKFYVAMVRDVTERKRFEKEIDAEKHEGERP